MIFSILNSEGAELVKVEALHAKNAEIVDYIDAQIDGLETAIKPVVVPQNYVLDSSNIESIINALVDKRVNALLNTTTHNKTYDTKKPFVYAVSNEEYVKFMVFYKNLIDFYEQTTTPDGKKIIRFTLSKHVPEVAAYADREYYTYKLKNFNDVIMEKCSTVFETIIEYTLPRE